MLLFAAFAGGEVLTSDTVWSEEILVSDDIVVPEGVTLTVLAGTVVRVLPSDSTKIDPECIPSDRNYHSRHSQYPGRGRSGGIFFYG